MRPIIHRRHHEPLCGFESDEGPEQKERSTNSAAEGQSRGLKRKQSTRPKCFDPLLHVKKGAGYLNSTLPEEQAKLFNRRTKEKKQNKSVEKKTIFYFESDSSSRDESFSLQTLAGKRDQWKPAEKQQDIALEIDSQESEEFDFEDWVGQQLKKICKIHDDDDDD